VGWNFFSLGEDIGVVMGVSTEYKVLGVKVSSREGLEATETARVESGEPIVLSQ
jgi:hypothetical protein